MNITVRQEAADDLDQLFQWIARDNLRAAANMVSRIRGRINALELNARLGRIGVVEGTLEFVEHPCIIIYRIDDVRGEVVVLSIVHGEWKRERVRSEEQQT